MSGSADKTVKIWSLATYEIVRELNGHSGPVKSLTLLPNDCLATGAIDKTIKLWDTSTGMLIRTINGHKGDVSALATLSPTKKLITKNTIKI